MLLGQLQQLTEPDANALQQLAVAEFTASCALAPYLQFYQIQGNGDTPRKTDDNINAGDTRTIGNDFATSKSNTPGFGTVALKIYGDKIKTDRAYERRGQDIGSQVSRDVANFARSFGRYFTNAIINHTGSGATIKGLKQLAIDNTRSVIYDSAGTGEVPAGNAAAERKSQQKFLEFLEEQIADVSGSNNAIIIANGRAKARLKTIGSNYITTTNVQDVFGANQSVDSFNELPIVLPGLASNGITQIIPNNETVSSPSRSGCTSLYVVVFGEEADVACATSTGLHVNHLGLVGSDYVTSVEMDVDMAMLSPKCLLRIEGLVFS